MAQRAGGSRSPRRDPGGRTGRRGPGGRDASGERAGAGGNAPAAGRGLLEERVVGGLHPVRELLRSDQDLTRILVASNRDPVAVLDDILALAAERGIVVDRVDRSELDRLGDGLVHQGVVALAPPYPHASLDDVLARAASRSEPVLLVALDGVTDPHNLGSIARTAEAVGAHGLLVPERRSAGVTPTAEKSAAGALAHLPVVEVTNLVRTLALLHERGVWSLGLDGEAELELGQHPLAGEPCVLVVGAEGGGLSRLVRERCDALVRLPMVGRVASLNASVAAGVALYELLRHRPR